MGQYLSQGSKGINTTDLLDVDVDPSSDLMTSYPPTPFVPGSPGHMSLELDISIMTGDSSDGQLSPPPPSLHHSPTADSRVISPSFRRRYMKEDDRGDDSITLSSGSVEELKAYLDTDPDDLPEIGRCTTPLPPVTLEGDEKYDRETMEVAGTSREIMPINIRPPVYPILPGTSSGGVSLSSSEESVEDITAPGAKKEKRIGKQMTPRAAAVIASRFLVGMSRSSRKSQDTQSTSKKVVKDESVVNIDSPDKQESDGSN